LDGLRGLAIIAVFLYHGRVEWMQGATTAITIFFPLSGYLITRNLLREIEGTGGLQFRVFWVRRFRRLMPAATIAVGFALIVGAWRNVRPTAMETIAALTGWKNWHFLAAGRVGDLLIVWWSLAIEEQYYLVYPGLVLLLLKFGGRRSLTIALSAIALLSFVTLIYSIATGRAVTVYYGTHGRLWEILSGCLLAIAGRLPTKLRMPAWVATPILIACQSSLLAHTGSKWADPVRISVTIVATLWFIDAVASRAPSRTLRVMDSWPLKPLGLISYEIYLLHWTLLVALPELRGTRLFTVGGAFGLAIVAAMVLHRITEPMRVPSVSLTNASKAKSGKAKANSPARSG
jgi:peptidoglycan/LPS O-acetylase OafA/YrhL